MDLTMIMIIILYFKHINFKDNLLVSEKILKNTKPSQFQQKKKLRELMKMKKKLQKPQVIHYNLLIVQDLWQAHYRILLTILLNNLAEGFDKTKCKYDQDNKKM